VAIATAEARRSKGRMASRAYQPDRPEAIAPSVLFATSCRSGSHGYANARTELFIPARAWPSSGAVLPRLFGRAHRPKQAEPQRHPRVDPLDLVREAAQLSHAGQAEKAAQLYLRAGALFIAANERKRAVCLYRLAAKLDTSIETTILIAKAFDRAGVLRDSLVQYRKAAVACDEIGDDDRSALLWRRVSILDPENARAPIAEEPTTMERPSSVPCEESSFAETIISEISAVFDFESTETTALMA
jgi:hypothetical protein